MTAPDITAIRGQMSALSGFTPGYWHSSNQPGDWGLGGAHHIHVAGANPYECDQCITHIEYQTPYCLGEKRSVIEAADQAAANARLIAAAPDMHATILALCDALDALRAENERLRRALEPFAEAEKYFDSSFDDDYSSSWAEFFTIGDFRRALAAMEAGHART